MSTFKQLPIEKYTMSTQDVADLLGYHVEHVRLLRKQGKLPCIRRGSAFKFNREQVEQAMIERLEQISGLEGESGSHAGTDSNDLGI